MSLSISIVLVNKFYGAARRWKRERREEMSGRVGVSTAHRAVTVTVSKVRVHREKNQAPSLKVALKKQRPAWGEEDGKLTMEAACPTNSPSHQELKGYIFLIQYSLLSLIHPVHPHQWEN